MGAILGRAQAYRDFESLISAFQCGFLLGSLLCVTSGRYFIMQREGRNRSFTANLQNKSAKESCNVDNLLTRNYQS